MATQHWAEPDGAPPEWARADGASSHSDPSKPRTAVDGTALQEAPNASAQASRNASAQASRNASAQASPGPQVRAVPDPGAEPVPLAVAQGVPEALASIERVLDDVPAARWQDVPESELRGLAQQVARLTARLSAHQLAAARALDKAGTARRAGAASTGQLMANDFGGDRRAADDLVRTAGVLEDSGATATEDALGAGEISPEQAKIIGRTLAALPKHLTETERDTVERKLLGEAGRLSLADLRRRSKRALEDVRPDPEPDDDENRKTSRQEKSAWEKTCFSLWDRKDGTHGFNGIVPDLQATQLRALLDAVVSPRRQREPGMGADRGGSDGSTDRESERAREPGSSGEAHAENRPPTEDGLGAPTDQSETPPETTPEEMTPYPNQLGQALCALIDHFPTDGFAQAGGAPVSLAITFAYEHLANLSAEVAGTLTDGLRVSAGEIRRLACTQQLIPQVFNGRSVPLDQGMAKRLFTKEQRRILAQRDLGCAFPGCDRPPQWCDAHHVVSWSRGGGTDLSNGVLLCFFHHHAVHDQGWSVRLHPGDGLPEFSHPEHTGGRWLRNHRFRASSSLVPHLRAGP